MVVYFHSMHKFIWKWLTAYYVLLGKIVCSDVVPCGHFVHLDEQPYYECLNGNITEIPQNIKPDIRWFIVSWNKYGLPLKKDSFALYPDLIRLSIVEPNEKNKHYPADESTFLPLEKLEELVLCHTFYNTDFKFPSSIKTLLLCTNNFKNFDVSHLKLLNNLTSYHNNLYDLPKIHDLAPLKILDIYYNPMNNLTAESLAHYCMLTYLDLHFSVTEPITMEKYCQCCRLQKWIDGRNITVKQPTNTINCSTDISQNRDPAKCNYNFSEASTNFEECLKKHATGATAPAAAIAPTWITILAILVSVAVFLIVFVITLIVYLCFFRKGKTDETSGTNETSENNVDDEPPEATDEEDEKDE